MGRCVDFRKCGELCSSCCSAGCTGRSCSNSFWVCVPWSTPREFSTLSVCRVLHPLCTTGSYLLHRFAPQQLADLLHGLDGMGQPPPESLLAGALLEAARSMLEGASTAKRSPPGSSYPPSCSKTTSSPTRGPSISRGAKTAVAADSKVTHAAKSETSEAHVTGSGAHVIMRVARVIMSGTHVSAVLTWAAAAGMQLPAEWLSWYTAFVCRVLRAPSSSRQPPSSSRPQADPQASSLLLSASRQPPSSSRPNNERGAFSVAMRPRDHLAILEALATLHEQGLLPHRPPPPEPLPQHQAACSPYASLDVSKPSAPALPAVEMDFGGAQAAASAAVEKVQPPRRTSADGDCGVARLLTRALVPAVTNAAKRQLANGPLVARTCAALARLTGGGGGGGDSSRAQVSLLPPPGRRYVAAVETATRWHMPTLSVAEVASTAEALTTWCDLQQRQQQEGLTGHGGGAGREIAPPPLRGSDSGKPASLVSFQGDSELQFTLLPAAWSASAVVHTRRAAVLRACRDASELLDLAQGFRRLGCRAPPLWFEAVLEEALWRCGQWEQQQQQRQHGGGSKGPKEQQEEAEGSSGRRRGRADGSQSRASIENHGMSRGGGDGKQQPDLLMSKGWSATAQSSSSGDSQRWCDDVAGHRERDSSGGRGGVSADDAATAAFMRAAQMVELRRLLQLVPGAEDAMRLLALGRPDLLEPS